MNIDKEAQARIEELQGDLDEAQTVIVILQEENAELHELNKVLRGQLQNLLLDHRYPDLKAG